MSQKVTTIGTLQYRAKHVGFYYGGEKKFRIEIRSVLWGFIPLSTWDYLSGDYTSIAPIEKYLKEKIAEYNGEIMSLNINKK